MIMGFTGRHAGVSCLHPHDHRDDSVELMRVSGVPSFVGVCRCFGTLRASRVEAVESNETLGLVSATALRKSCPSMRNSVLGSLVRTVAVLGRWCSNPSSPT